jgi:ElaA protein
MSTTIHWTTKLFAALTLAELYALLQLRSEVFVVEQTCAFQDIDGQDQVALHLLGHTEAGELAAYARLFEAGRSYAQASIGRVVTSPRHRGQGLGRQLLYEAIAQCEAQFGWQPIKIGVQQYLLKLWLRGRRGGVPRGRHSARAHGARLSVSPHTLS